MGICPKAVTKYFVLLLVFFNYLLKSNFWWGVSQTPPKSHRTIQLHGNDPSSLVGCLHTNIHQFISWWCPLANFVILLFHVTSSNWSSHHHKPNIWQYAWTTSTSPTLYIYINNMINLINPSTINFQIPHFSSCLRVKSTILISPIRSINYQSPRTQHPVTRLAMARLLRVRPLTTTRSSADKVGAL
jgi:hypothetical protein